MFMEIKTITELKSILEGKENGKRVHEPLMNSRGVSRILKILSPIKNNKPINRNEFMNLQDEVIDDLVYHHQDYDIKNKSDLDIIEGLTKRMLFVLYKEIKNKIPRLKVYNVDRIRQIIKEFWIETYGSDDYDCNELMMKF